MSDSKENNSVNLKNLSICQLQSLKENVAWHIRRKQREIPLAKKLGKEIAAELKDMGYGSVKVQAEYEVIIRPGYMPHTLKYQRVEAHPDVIDYRNRLQHMIQSLVTPERLAEHNLSSDEATFEQVEFAILQNLS